MAKKLHKCKSGKDFVKYAKRQGCEVRTCKSSHVMVKVEGHGAMTVPTHGNKQLGTGLRRVIIKFFLAAGLGLLVVGMLGGVL